MKPQSFPHTILPEVHPDHNYGYFYDTKVVLGKTKEGYYFTVYVRLYLDDYNNVESYEWKYTGRDGYNVDNLECWAYIPEF